MMTRSLAGERREPHARCRPAMNRRGVLLPIWSIPHHGGYDARLARLRDIGRPLTPHAPLTPTEKKTLPPVTEGALVSSRRQLCGDCGGCGGCGGGPALFHSRRMAPMSPGKYRRRSRRNSTGTSKYAPHTKYSGRKPTFLTTYPTEPGCNSFGSYYSTRGAEQLDIGKYSTQWTRRLHRCQPERGFSHP